MSPTAVKNVLDRARESHAQLWEQGCEDIGAAGTTVAALCCLGIPSFVSLASAAGAGFLAHGALRLPLLVCFLVITLAGLLLGLLHHGKPWPLLLGVASGGAILVCSIMSTHAIFGFASIGAFIAATILNIWFEHEEKLYHHLTPMAAREWKRVKRHSREFQ